jgi:hypothetical protein
MKLLGDVDQVVARFGMLGDSANLARVFVEHTIGSEVVLEAPDGTPRGHGSCGISFRSV